ncbi:MAG: FecR domain-containing protein [Betaproteobacteria bacterium]
MMRTAVFLVAATLACASVAMAQDTHVALFKSVSGDVKLMRGGTTVVPVAGTPILRSDVVVSGPGSSGGIVFVDGTTLAVDASTEVEIRRYVFQPESKQYDFALYLKKGSAIYSSGKLGKLSPESVEVSTPRAAIGVRGTRFIVSAD